jgi:hypothetical protein
LFLILLQLIFHVIFPVLSVYCFTIKLIIMQFFPYIFIFTAPFS